MNREEKDENYCGTVVVVPTRNRARIAMNAIRSVLDEPSDGTQFLVSDNSTSEVDQKELAEFCTALNDRRLRYIRPPRSLAMPAHWQWAIEQALAGYNASHFTYLTDRMMFKTGSLKELLNLVVLYPNKVISYNHDRIVDHVRPVRLEQYPATGKLWEVQSERFSWLVSQSMLHHGLPRMLNCLVPRSVLYRLRERFGSVFASIAPDFNFCFRCLDVEESILFFDKSPIFHYALNRSNGASVSRGEMTIDNADFTANLPVDEAIRNYATPIPQLNTAVNAVFNEYLVFKQESRSPRFYEIDHQKYLAANAVEINEVGDPQLRAEMRGLLIQHGYRVSDNGLASSAKSWLRRSRSAFRKLGSPTQSLETGIVFRELDEAIDYARNSASNVVPDPSAVRELLRARELPVQSG